MEGLLVIALGFTFIGGAIVGGNTARVATINRCVQKPAECKKEFDFYQLKKEVETMKGNQK